MTSKMPPVPQDQRSHVGAQTLTRKRIRSNLTIAERRTQKAKQVTAKIFDRILRMCSTSADYDSVTCQHEKPAYANTLAEEVFGVSAYSILKQAVTSFIANEALSRGAAISFYIVTSLAPVLLILSRWRG